MDRDELLKQLEEELGIEDLEAITGGYQTAGSVGEDRDLGYVIQALPILKKQLGWTWSDFRYKYRDRYTAKEFVELEKAWNSI